jgi:hypothetical protein
MIYSDTVGVTISDHLNFIVPRESRSRSRSFQFVGIPLQIIDPDAIFLDHPSREEDGYSLKLGLKPPQFYISNGQQEFSDGLFVNIIHADDLRPLSKAIAEIIRKHSRMTLSVEQQPTIERHTGSGNNTKLRHITNTSGFLGETKDLVSDPGVLKPMPPTLAEN